MLLTRDLCRTKRWDIEDSCFTLLPDQLLARSVSLLFAIRTHNCRYVRMLCVVCEPDTSPIYRYILIQHIMYWAVSELPEANLCREKPTAASREKINIWDCSRDSITSLVLRSTRDRTVLYLSSEIAPPALFLPTTMFPF